MSSCYHVMEMMMNVPECVYLNQIEPAHLPLTLPCFHHCFYPRRWADQDATDTPTRRAHQETHERLHGVCEVKPATNGQRDARSWKWGGEQSPGGDMALPLRRTTTTLLRRGKQVVQWTPQDVSRYVRVQHSPFGSKSQRMKNKLSMKNFINGVN